MMYDQATCTLTIPPYWNGRLVNLPLGIKNLIFAEDIGNNICSKFNDSIENLPNTITTIKLGYSFNGFVDFLPSSLQILTLGYSFNQPVDNLPQKLTHLTFGAWFNKPIDNLPNSITHLTLGKYYSKEVSNLPYNLQILRIPYTFKKLKKVPFGCEVFFYIKN